MAGGKRAAKRSGKRVAKKAKAVGSHGHQGVQAVLLPGETLLKTVPEREVVDLGNTFVGTAIAFKWNPPWGWARGVVQRHLRGNKQHDFNVLYDVDGEMRGQRLLRKTYSCDDNATVGSWAIINARRAAK